MVLKSYLVKAEASINHAFVVMPETLLSRVTIIVLPASFTPIFGIDLIIVLPWVTNVLKSKKKILLVFCLVYRFKSAFGFVTISWHLFRFEPISWCLCFLISSADTSLNSWFMLIFVSNKLLYLSFQTNLILPLCQVG